MVWSWSRDVGPLLLATLADTFTEWAGWEKGGGFIKGRFRIDPFEVPTGTIAPGIGEIQTWFYCDRRVVPPPLPQLGDVLTIVGQVWEIVQRDEDDLGELGFRLIKQELGLIFEPPEGAEGDWDDKQSLWDQTVPDGPSRWDRGVTGSSAGRRSPGRPSRRGEIAEVFQQAATAGMIGPDVPLNYAVAVVRSRLGSDQRGLGDRTIRRTVGALLEAQKRHS